MNVLTAMTRLWMSRPGPSTSTPEAAAWFAARAELHAHLALLGGPDGDRARLLAIRAQERSTVLARAAQQKNTAGLS
jgi:hypothetical protein